MACSSGCRTPGEHSSYGECLRAKGTTSAFLETVGSRSAYSANKRMLRENAAYRAAKAEGLQPQAPTFAAVDAARRAADAAA